MQAEAEHSLIYKYTWYRSNITDLPVAGDVRDQNIYLTQNRTLIGPLYQKMWEQTDIFRARVWWDLKKVISSVFNQTSKEDQGFLSLLFRQRFPDIVESWVIFTRKDKYLQFFFSFWISSS